MNISLRSYFMSRSSQKSKPFLGGNIFHYSDHLLRFWVILAKTVGAYDSYLLCHFHRRCLRCFQPSFSFVKFIQLFFIFCFYVCCQSCNFSNCFTTHFCTGYVFIQSSQLDRHYPTTVVKTQINFFGFLVEH